jgi:tetratricopeptide (TPR) repeat protein
MKLLAGYPLAMEVVLANLKRQLPEEIWQGLQLAELVNVGDENKTNNIIKCVEYSHSNLSEEAQKLLLCLAPFSGFIYLDIIPYYAKELQKFNSFSHYPFEQFGQAIQEAISWGLLAPIDARNPHLLNTQPVLSFFLKTKLKEESNSLYEDLQGGFKQLYLGLSRHYKQQLESRNPEEQAQGKFFCQKDYENLYNALEMCLDKQEDIGIFFCLEEYFKSTNQPQDRLKLAKYVCERLENYPANFLEGELGYQMAMAFDRLAWSYLVLKQYELAKTNYQKFLQSLDQLRFINEREKQLAISSTYHQLGFLAEELRKWEQARSYYQQSLEIKIEYGDRFYQAMTLHQLGNLAQELREWEQARSYYRQALEIYIEYGTRYEQASTLHNLGRVAEGVGELSQAKSYYLQALQILAEFNDNYSVQTFSLPRLVALYQQTQDEEIFVAVADILGVGVEKVRGLLEG